MSTAKMLRLQILILVPLFFLPTTDVIIHPAYQQWKNEKIERQNTARRLVQYLAASNRQLMADQAPFDSSIEIHPGRAGRFGILPQPVFRYSEKSAIFQQHRSC